MNIQHLVLPKSLRSKLKTPKGRLFEGEPDKTTTELISYLKINSHFLIAVGDVCSELLVAQGYEPDIIFTDGKTKRKELEQKLEFGKFEIIHSKCPPAEITEEVWILIRHLAMENRSGIHVVIDGEEDLLVLPLLAEFPDNTAIVYGQPDSGVVLRIVDDESRAFAIEILQLMDKV